MNYETDKDYILRLIKEIARTLSSLVLGKKYEQEDLSVQSRYGLSDDRFAYIKNMVDRGEVNEAENILLDQIDYGEKTSVAELIFFYEYAGIKGDEFLKKYNYSMEEVLEGLKMLADHLGYQDVLEVMQSY